MASHSKTDVDGILAAIPHLYRGVGGSAAVVQNGEVLAKRSFGYANLDEREPMTPSTLLPICSISKQMVCLTMASLLRNPTPAMLLKSADPWQLMNEELKRLLPHVSGLPDGELRVDHLYNMQSGIRDYWCLTTLYGAKPDGRFSIGSDAPKAIERTKSLHFPSGAEMSYSNVNFYVLGKILENVSGQSLSQLLVERLFVPAGMSTASLYINTNGLPLPIAGYEGNEKVGYFEALNRIEWAGDAGIACSLNDMIAYERYLQRSYSDPSSLYYHTSRPQTFRDGTKANYGFGLIRNTVAGHTGIRHGGALRGFRLSRMHFPEEQISIVVMLNHEGDAGDASNYIFKQLLNLQEPQPTPALKPASSWVGDYLDEDTQLYLNVKIPLDKPGKIDIQYRFTHETFPLTSETSAETDTVKATLDGNVLHVIRSDDNRVLRARRIQKPTHSELYNANSADYVGFYRSDELDSTFHVTGEKGTLYGSFDGYLGKGPIWLMRYLGEDVWILGNPRGMDASPPGDWTVVWSRDDKGVVKGVTLGCNLARHNVYKRV